MGGCCDCGDPDGWAEEGNCSDHKGFAASAESMLKALPDYIRNAGEHVFTSLAKSLKYHLLQIVRNNKSENLKKGFV